MNIERDLWKSLLAIATGKVTVYKALEDFFKNISWDTIDMVSDADRAYFADGKVPLK